MTIASVNSVQPSYGRDSQPNRSTVSSQPHHPTAQLSIRNVTKVFPGKQDLLSKVSKKTTKDFTAIEGISLDIEPNTFVSIIYWPLGLRKVYAAKHDCRSF